MTIRYSTVVQIKNGNRWEFYSQQAWKRADYPYEAGETPMSDVDYLQACPETAPSGKLRIMPRGEGQDFPNVHAAFMQDEERESESCVTCAGMGTLQGTIDRGSRIRCTTCNGSGIRRAKAGVR
jgi:hypothetical protein